MLKLGVRILSESGAERPGVHPQGDAEALPPKPGAAASRAAYELLRQMLVREGFLHSEAALPEMEKASGGKPRFFEGPEVHFNISHSGRFLACAISDREVGVDIQEYRPPADAVMRRFFDEKERASILEAEDREAAFAAVWAERECRAKYTGRGIFAARQEAEAGSEACHVITCDTGAPCALKVCSPYASIDEIMIQRP